MLLSQLFRKAAITQPSQFKPKCAQCQQYRVLIHQAKGGPVWYLNALRADFNTHVTKEHTHADHS